MKPRTADIIHDGQEDSFAAHLPQYSDICPHCRKVAARGRHITALHSSLVEFGYTTLTRDEVAAAYDGALAGEDPSGDIIRLMVARQMGEAGLIPERS